MLGDEEWRDLKGGEAGLPVFHPHLGLDQVGMLQPEQLGQLVDQVVLVLVEGAVGEDDRPR